MKRSDFAYELPAGLIAQEPRTRGASRMMVVTPGGGAPAIAHESFAAFPSMLEPGDVVVLNDTRVIPARLFAEPKGQMKRRIEILLTRQIDANTWESWANPARRIHAGDELRFSDALIARVMEKREGTIV